VTEQTANEKGLTNAQKVLLILAKEGRLNTRQIAVRLGKQYIYVRNLLYELKRRGYVECEYVRRYFEGLSWILVNEWTLTKQGKKYLKDLKLI